MGAIKVVLYQIRIVLEVPWENSHHIYTSTSLQICFTLFAIVCAFSFVCFEDWIGLVLDSLLVSFEIMNYLDCCFIVVVAKCVPILNVILLP